MSKGRSTFDWQADFVKDKYYSKPETDLQIARPLLSTMAKMHRVGVDKLNVVVSSI